MQIGRHRIDGETPVVSGKRLLGPVQRRQRAAEAAMGRFEVGLDRNRLPEMGGRLVQPVERRQRLGGRDGLRYGMISTETPTPMRVVCAAMNDSATNGS